MPFKYRLHQLLFRTGRTIELDSALTVFVGANNCGKSRLLKDILAITCGLPVEPVLLAEVYTQLPGTVREAAESYDMPVLKENSTAVIRFVKSTFDGQEERRYEWNSWPDGIFPGQPQPHQFRQLFGAYLTAFLNTSGRLTLIERGPLDSNTCATLLQQLYDKGKPAELAVREKIKQAFPATELALDFTAHPAIEFRVGTDFSQVPADPRDAKSILRAHEKLDQQGDGIRSYAGIVTAMTCAKRPVLLIDEPEAFLHPPQAFRIGEFIADHAGNDQQVVLATHSVDVLRGLVSISDDLKIIRLSRSGNATSFSILDKAEVVHLYSDPLLSGAGVLNGLFFSGVIVTEADGDSRFYEAIAKKIDPTRDLHMINADNKQTVPKVLKIYQRMGVRAVGILDVDVLNNKHNEFERQLDAIEVTEQERSAALAARARIEIELKGPSLAANLTAISESCVMIKGLVDEAAALSEPEKEIALNDARTELGRARDGASIWKSLKKEGRSILAQTVQDFDQISALFRSRGIFINPCGELEGSFGPILPHTSNKRKWLREALVLVESTEVNAVAYPWKMIVDIHAYLDQPV